MNRFTWFLGMTTLLCLAQSLDAAEVCTHSLGRELRCTRCASIPCCCCDDYCRKPLPCVPCLTFAPSCNAYCRKPEPCLPCYCPGWCPDTYCPKPLPKFCWPVLNEFYRCPPGKDAATCSGCKP